MTPLNYTSATGRHYPNAVAAISYNIDIVADTVTINYKVWESLEASIRYAEQPFSVHRKVLDKRNIPCELLASRDVVGMLRLCGVQL